MKVRKCIIPIAGRGTRFLPITKAVSKEMLPIVNKPNIFYQVRECMLSGIEEVIFVVGKHNEELVKKFFSKDLELLEFLGDSEKTKLLDELNEILAKIKFKYVMQDENKRGTAGAIYAARDLIDKDEYFAVMFGDDLVLYSTPPLKEMIEYFNIVNTNIVGVGKIPEELLGNYGLCKYKKDNIVEDFVRVSDLEKAPSKESLLGKLIVHETIFKKILSSNKMANNEYSLPRVLLELNEEIRAYEFSGKYYDIGSTLGYIKANIAFGLKDDKINKELREYLKGEYYE